MMDFNFEIVFITKAGRTQYTYLDAPNEQAALDTFKGGMNGDARVLSIRQVEDHKASASN